MSTKLHSVSNDSFFKSKNMLFILVGLILVVLFLIYMSSGSSSEGEELCGCATVSQEGIQYAKRVPAKEGIKTTYAVESPALKAMFEAGKKEGLTYAKTQKLHPLLMSVNNLIL